MKIIHSADWHYSDRDHDEIRQCVDFMISKAHEERPDLIVVSGDITDSQNLKLDSKSAKTICRQFSELAEIAPVVNIIGTPSHDGRSAEILRYVRGDYQIHISEKPEQIYLLKGGRLTDSSGLEYIDDHSCIKAVITQIPTPTKQFFQADSAIDEGDKAVSGAMTSILGAFGVTAGMYNCPHILNGHFQVGGAFISDTQQLIGRDIEISTDQLSMANANVVCLGHIHKAQEMRGNVFYSGSIYRKNFGELESKGFYVHEVTTDSIHSSFIETPTSLRLVLREDFTKKDIRDLELVIYTYGPDELKGALVKCEFKVWQDEAGMVNQAELERSFLDAGAAKADVSLIRIPRETVRAAKVLQLVKLRDKIMEMASLRMEKVGDEILAKADLLESTDPEELIQVVGRVN
jgi:DNA repair exonuclease SbcCD nuclease subunit